MEGGKITVWYAHEALLTGPGPAFCHGGHGLRAREPDKLPLVGQVNRDGGKGECGTVIHRRAGADTIVTVVGRNVVRAFVHMIGATELRGAGIGYRRRLHRQEKGESAFESGACHVFLLPQSDTAGLLGSDGRMG
jgi:hypothetical protein